MTKNGRLSDVTPKSEMLTMLVVELRGGVCLFDETRVRLEIQRDASTTPSRSA
jgi:hypothetical protein